MKKLLLLIALIPLAPMVAAEADPVDDYHSVLVIGGLGGGPTDAYWYVSYPASVDSTGTFTLSVTASAAVAVPPVLAMTAGSFQGAGCTVGAFTADAAAGVSVTGYVPITVTGTHCHGSIRFTFSGTFGSTAIRAGFEIKQDTVRVFDDPDGWQLETDINQWPTLNADLVDDSTDDGALTGVIASWPTLKQDCDITPSSGPDTVWFSFGGCAGATVSVPKEQHIRNPDGSYTAKALITWIVDAGVYSSSAIPTVVNSVAGQFPFESTGACAAVEEDLAGTTERGTDTRYRTGYWLFEITYTGSGCTVLLGVGQTNAVAGLIPITVNSNAGIDLSNSNFNSTFGNLTFQQESADATAGAFLKVWAPLFIAFAILGLAVMRRKPNYLAVIVAGLFFVYAGFAGTWASSGFGYMVAFFGVYNVLVGALEMRDPEDDQQMEGVETNGDED